MCVMCCDTPRQRGQGRRREGSCASCVVILLDKEGRLIRGGGRREREGEGGREGGREGEREGERKGGREEGRE